MIDEGVSKAISIFLNEVERLCWPLGKVPSLISQVLWKNWENIEFHNRVVEN